MACQSQAMRWAPADGRRPQPIENRGICNQPGFIDTRRCPPKGHHGNRRWSFLTSRRAIGKHAGERTLVARVACRQLIGNHPLVMRWSGRSNAEAVFTIWDVRVWPPRQIVDLASICDRLTTAFRLSPSFPLWCVYPNRSADLCPNVARRWTAVHQSPW